MLNSSNIRIITNTLLKAARIIRRDFSELEKIQSTKKNVDKFVIKSLENIKEIIKYDLKKARSEAEIIFVNDESILNNRQEYSFIVDPISGLKNLLMALVTLPHP